MTDYPLSLIEVCEQLLEGAKSGELLALAFATVTTPDGETIRNIKGGSGWAGAAPFMPGLHVTIKELAKRFGEDSRKIVRAPAPKSPIILNS